MTYEARAEVPEASPEEASETAWEAPEERDEAAELSSASPAKREWYDIPSSRLGGLSSRSGRGSSSNNSTRDGRSGVSIFGSGSRCTGIGLLGGGG